MAKKVKVTFCKRAFGMRFSGSSAKVGDPAPGEYALQDNQDGSVTILGVDAAGVQVDISGIATLAAVSDAPDVLTVDAPADMTVAYHGVKPGKAKVALTATANDGSFTFTVDDPCDVAMSGVTGLVVTHGTPTVR